MRLKNMLNIILMLVFLLVGCEKQLTKLSESKEQIEPLERAAADSDIGQVKYPITDTLDMLFVRIPAGGFVMGSPEDEKDREEDEGPLHKVIITKPFYLGVYEVTQNQWNKVMGIPAYTNPSKFAGRPDNPVEQVSRAKIREFFQRINSREEGFFRLPTEAEWEYACRAGTTTRFYWGDDQDYKKMDEYVWHAGYPDGTTHPVGQKKPNPWGLYDMGGNVSEFCQDRYGPYEAEEQIDPIVKEEGEGAVSRGGDWFHFHGSRSADRSCIHGPDSGLFFVGFRIVREIE
jgi:formylglycine-generating enzyme required for sulfatase activity